MGLAHQPAHGGQVAGAQRGGGGQHAPVLRHDVAAPPVDAVRHRVPAGVEHFQRHVAQRANRGRRRCEHTRPLVALGAALVVAVAGERVCRHRVADDDLDPLGHWDPVHGERARVQQQGAPRPAVAGDELIHHPALRAGELALRLLAHPRDRGGLERQARYVEERAGRCDFQRGRGAQPRADRDGAVDGQLRAGQPAARPLEHRGHAANIVGPGPGRAGGLRVEIDVGRLGICRRAEHQPAIAARGRLDRGEAVDRHRQDVAVVVIRVLADEIDAAGRASRQGHADANTVCRERPRPSMPSSTMSPGRR